MSIEQIIEQIEGLGPEAVDRLKTALTEREAEIEACRLTERRFKEMEMRLVKTLTKEQVFARVRKVLDED